METKIVNNFPNYSVSIDGKVFNNKTGRVLHQYIDKTGYKGVYLYNENGRKYYLVHRLVAMAFVPNKNNYPEVNHMDENKQNNKADNLEWCTRMYNVHYGTGMERSRQWMSEHNPWLGRKHTEESKKKMSEAKKGQTSKKRRKVTINGVQYQSITEAMQILNVSTRRIYKILAENEV